MHTGVIKCNYVIYVETEIYNVLLYLIHVFTHQNIAQLYFSLLIVLK